MGKSILEENSVNCAKPWAQFKEPIARGMDVLLCKKASVSGLSWLFWGACMGLGMPACLLPWRLKKVLVLCFVFPLVVLGKIIILLN